MDGAAGTEESLVPGVRAGIKGRQNDDVIAGWIQLAISLIDKFGVG